jgi:hypothetical protein
MLHRYLRAAIVSLLVVSTSVSVMLTTVGSESVSLRIDAPALSKAAGLPPGNPSIVSSQCRELAAASGCRFDPLTWLSAQLAIELRHCTASIVSSAHPVEPAGPTSERLYCLYCVWVV